MLNVREEALIAQKRTCLYHLSAVALILLEDQEKRKKEQAKEEISPPKKRKTSTVWVEWSTRKHYFIHCDQLLTELHKEDPRGYTNDLRITSNLFQQMVERLILRRPHS